ncbi:MAG: hypothetical protein V9G29_04865 [Burkholderiaceae bacterium]
MGVSAAYLASSGEAACDLTPELSRRARGVDAWAALASLGRSGLRELIERCCVHAQRFAEGPSGRGARGAQRCGPEPGAGPLR